MARRSFHGVTGGGARAAIWAAIGSVCLPAGWGQAAKIANDLPVGIFLKGAGTEIVQPVIRTHPSALAGMLLYPSDTISTGGTAAEIALCGSANSARLRYRIWPNSQVALEAAGLRAVAGGFDVLPAPAVCELPATVRFPVAATGGGLAGSGRQPETRDQRVGLLNAVQQEELRSALQAVERAIGADPADVAAQVARVAVFERFGLVKDADDEYRALAAAAPGLALGRGVTPAPPPPPANACKQEGPGRTFALLIGISAYKPESGVSSLQFADHDAETFRDFLMSDRGGAVPKEQILMLRNQEATREAVQDGLRRFTAVNQGCGNTLIVLIAAHGANVPMTGTVGATAGASMTPRSAAGGGAPPEPPQPYILTYDTNPQDVRTAGIPMSELRENVVEQAGRFRQVLLYLDVCRAGQLWPVRVTAKELNKETRSELETAEPNLGVMLATDPEAQERYASAYESPDLDRHGAFTYYVLSGLNGEVDADSGKVLFSDLASHVNTKVRKATEQKQQPFGHATNPNLAVVENAKAEGIKLPAPAHLPIATAPIRGKLAARPAVNPEEDVAGNSLESRFLAAMGARLLLPRDGPENAFELLRRLRGEMAGRSAEASRYENQLRLALEEAGQDILNTYLRGAQPPLHLKDFQAGAAYFSAALEIAPDARFDESRKLFCEGRALLFQKDYARAMAALERSIQLDPTRAYAYNALGIAYLERLPAHPEYGAKARDAFQDARRFAPYWAYPLFNLALLDKALLHYEEAFDELAQAERLAPLYSYIPYTIGVLNQQLHRPEEAERYLAKALEVGESARQQGKDRRIAGRWPERADILNALGTLSGEEGRKTRAVRYFRQAIEVDDQNLDARLNLAALIMRNRGGSKEAEYLLRDLTMRHPDEIKAHLLLGQLLIGDGRDGAAADEYEWAMRGAPDYAEGWVELARLRLRNGDTARAVEALKRGEPWIHDPIHQEAAGDLYVALGQRAEAVSAWRRAMTLAEALPPSAWRDQARKRLTRKLSAAPNR